MAGNRFGTISAKNLQLNGLSTLPSNQYNSALNFPVVDSNLHAFRNGGLSDFDGTAWYGDNLAELGAIGSAVDHVGNTTFCDFSGSEVAYINSTALNTANEAFTLGCWIKSSTLATSYHIFGKYAASADRSFLLQTGTNGNAIFYLYTDGVDTNKQLTVNGLAFEIHNGQWNHLVFRYDPSARTITAFFNGKIVGNLYDSTLNNRNNSANEYVSFGGRYAGGAGANQFIGQMTDMFYYRGALSFSEIRQAYLIGSQKLGYLEGTKTRIMGETGPIGYYHINNTYTASFTTASDIPGFLLHAAETGKSRLTVNALVVLGSDGANLSMNIKNKTQAVDYVYSGYGEQLAGATSKYGRKNLISDFINLNKGDELVLYCTSKSGTAYFEDMTHAFIYELWDY